MIASGEDLKGQGVGSAYKEIVNLLENHAQSALRLSFNKSRGCDINHVHTVHPLCYLKMKTSSLPSCMHVHFLPKTLEGSIKLAGFAQKAFSEYVLKMYSAADELIVVNPIFIDPLVDLGLKRSSITYIPNVVASSDFHPQEVEDDNPLREKYGIKKGPFTVLGVGQVQHRKGVLDFIKIAKMLPDLQFLWVGGFTFGMITDGYAELTDAMENAPDNVTFTGIVEREDMNLIYNMSDVLLMTSYNELFPMAVLEAVNAGIPILVRDLELYERIYFTDYLRAEDNDAFQSILNRLATDGAFYDKACTSSKEIADYYSEDHVASLWIDYYRRIYEEYHNAKIG